MRFRQSAARPENRSWDRSWGQNSFAGLLNYFTASKIKKQFCLRNMKKKNEKQCLVWGSNSRPSIYIEPRDLYSVYCANEASARTLGNKYIFKHFSIFCFLFFFFMFFLFFCPRVHRTARLILSLLRQRSIG